MGEGGNSCAFRGGIRAVKDCTPTHLSHSIRPAYGLRWLCRRTTSGTIPASLFDVDTLFEYAFHRLDGTRGFAMKGIEEKRARRRKEVTDEMAELLGHCASTALGFPRAVCLSRPPLSCWLSAASSMRLTMRSADSPLLCSPHADIMLTHRSPQTTRLRKGRTPRSGQVITVRTVT